MDQNNIPQNNVNEISLREIIIKTIRWISYLRSKWKIIFLCTILCGTLGYLYAIIKKPTYIAILTFALEEDKPGGGGLSGALGIASSLGIDIGGGGSAGGAFSGANLLELMKSRMLVEKALLSPMVVNGQTQSLADYYIAFSNFKKDWGEKPELKDIQFKPTSDRSSFTVQQDSILGILFQEIAGENGLFKVSQKDKKVSIITIEVKSTDELFSKNFSQIIAKVVSDFYIDSKSKKAKLNYDILQKQTDSVRNELNSAITGVAVANDNTYNLNPALNIHRTPSARRQVDIQANTAILTQLVANLEMAKVSLRKETPLIQIIDTPILPLKKEKPGKFKFLIIGSAIGFLSVLIFLVISRLVNRAMRDSIG